MNAQRALGLGLALASGVPVWQALEALSRGDHLGTGLGAVLAWILARAGVELTRSATRATRTSDDR